MTDMDNIHSRLNYMEEKFDTKLTHLVESMSKMAGSIEKLSERQADVSLLMERSNQHGVQYDRLDKRVDALEQKSQLWELGTKTIFAVVAILSLSVISALVGLLYSQ